MHRQRNIYQSRTLDLLRNCLSDGQDGGCKQRGQTATIWLKALLMPRLAVCSRDLHWHWINWTLLCDTMEVSMLRLAWLPIAQLVFQPALTDRLELISGTGTKAIAVSRFREKLSPANWMQGVTTISRKISRSWAPRLQNSGNRWAKKWGPTCDRDISNSAIYTTAIYRAYTVYIDIIDTNSSIIDMDFLYRLATLVWCPFARQSVLIGMCQPKYLCSRSDSR